MWPRGQIIHLKEPVRTFQSHPTIIKTHNAHAQVQRRLCVVLRGELRKQDSRKASPLNPYQAHYSAAVQTCYVTISEPLVQLAISFHICHMCIRSVKQPGTSLNISCYGGRLGTKCDFPDFSRCKAGSGTPHQPH